MNVSQLISEQAFERPHKIALLAQKKTLLSFLKFAPVKYESLTFLEFEQRANYYAQTFLNNGLRAGDRVLVFVKPSLDFPVIIFAMFKAAIVPVFIDPGMGVDAMLQCVATSKAKGLIGIPKIHHLKLLKPSFFESVSISFVIQGRALNAESFESLVKKSSKEVMPLISDVSASTLAAILFTSGGTGTPKGVMYTHEMFIQQAFKLKQMFRLTPEDRDYPCFPLFGLFSLGLGLTVIMPEVDLMKPARVDAKKITKSLIAHKITFSTGSPALWARVAKYALRKKITLPLLKTVATFGAPVSLELHQDFSKVITSGELYTPYGATECLPVSIITSKEVLGETKYQTLKGFGTCVGYAASLVDIKILCPNTLKLLDGEVGEIIVSSNTMTMGYDGLPEATANIRWVDSATQKNYHRMGDMGRIDRYGRLWFYGRKAHNVQSGSITIYTEEIEPAVNQLTEVARSALIQVNEEVVLVVERHDAMIDLPETLKLRFHAQIKDILTSLPKGHLINRIELSTNFPVDTRHNIKIDRLKIAKNFGLNI